MSLGRGRRARTGCYPDPATMQDPTSLTRLLFSWGRGRGCRVDENLARGSEVTALKQGRQYSSLACNTHSWVANRENSKFDGWIDHDLLRNHLSHSVCQPLSFLPLPCFSDSSRWVCAFVSLV